MRYRAAIAGSKGGPTGVSRVAPQPLVPKPARLVVQQAQALEVARDTKIGVMPFQYPAQSFTLAVENFADAAGRSKRRYHVCTGKAVLIHQINRQRW